MTSIDNPAEFLRETAALMREKASNLTPGPWQYAEGIYPDGSGAILSDSDAEEAQGWGRLVMDIKAIGAEENASHIAAWDPAVALAVAGFLEEMARQEDFRKYGAGPDLRLLHQAMTIAKAYRRQS